MYSSLLPSEYQIKKMNKLWRRGHNFSHTFNFDRYYGVVRVTRGGYFG